MAKITPNFSASARHLFRHLNEPHKLRGNAIARRFLMDSQTGRFSAASERQGAGRLWRLVIDGAEAARHADLLAGQEERAHRHFAIATRCLIQRVHPTAVARELGISERQCYRDRAAVCERLARYVSAAPAEERAQAVHAFDRLDLRFERSAQLADLGCEDEAARLYAEIVRTQEPPSTKLRAFGMLSDVLLASGKPARARAAVDGARAVLQAHRHEMLEDDVEAGECRVALAGAKVAWDFAEFSRAAQASREAAVRCEAMLARNAAPDVALCADTFISRALLSIRYGHAGEAGDMLSKARALAPRHGSTRLSLETTLMNGSFDAAFSVGCRETGSELRLARLHRVVETALAAGLFKIAVKATVALSEEYGVRRDSGAVVEQARKAVAMAREIGGARFIAMTFAAASDCLTATDETRLVCQFSRHSLDGSPGSYEWIGRKMLQSWVDTRLRRYESAWSAAQDAERGARRSDNWRLQAAIQRQLADIAHKTGRSGQAREYVLQALDGAAKHGSCSSRLMTLLVAAKITGNAAFKREAWELQTAMHA
jgi:hypothetical protein